MRPTRRPDGGRRTRPTPCWAPTRPACHRTRRPPRRWGRSGRRPRRPAHPHPGPRPALRRRRW
ncbi:hypothetical protein [Ornithinimicrobium kibberense]|uniref:hypothetical protein n=1 Tax=Ornithinimicrobium kibberense TaxID=282060 RepID=UPI003609F26A